MVEASRHDAWNTGESYDAYMGRWSRELAPQFLEWLGASDHLNWLEIGCGTGALSQEILTRCNPESLIAIDPSEEFVTWARAKVTEKRAIFQVGDAQALAFEAASRDVVVSGLVLNFVPDKRQALAEMMRVTRPGGQIAFYVWDYPAGAVEFLQAFWKAATTLDTRVAELSEDKRFPDCTQPDLIALAKNAGLSHVESCAIEIPTVFRNFDDYWHPFTMGAGPAPGYCTSLAPDVREHLRQTLREALFHSEAGSIHLKARAWAIKATVQ